MPEARRPLPEPDEVTRPCWQACRRRQLCFQSCRACAHRWLHAAVVCPRCWAAGTEWIAAAGEAKVFSNAVYRRAYHPAFEPLLPYVVAVVELAEGPRLVSNVVGADPADLQVGMSVRLDFLDLEDTALPVFRPVIGRCS